MDLQNASWEGYISSTPGTSIARFFESFKKNKKGERKSRKSSVFAAVAVDHCTFLQLDPRIFLPLVKSILPSIFLVHFLWKKIVKFGPMFIKLSVVTTILGALLVKLNPCGFVEVGICNKFEPSRSLITI